LRLRKPRRRFGRGAQEPDRSTMRFDTSQHMRMSQQMKLAPRMIQSMEILQMPLLQLEERIEQELECNATLETLDPSDDNATPDGSPSLQADRLQAERDARADDQPLKVDEGSAAEDFARLESFEESLPDAAENAHGAAASPIDRRDEALGTYS